MPKEQYTTNSPDELLSNTSKDLPNNSLPARTGPYRPISAKRPRDPSQRKSVSFNDVPTIYEVPSHDVMRGSNGDAYRSWTYTDATLPTSATSSLSLYSPQTIIPPTPNNVSAQKLQANRLSSALYSTSSTLTTANRLTDWASRTRTTKSIPTTEETTITNENNASSNASVIVVQTPDEKINKDTTVKNNNQSTYSNPYLTYPQSTSTSSATPTATSASSSSIAPENAEEKRYSFRTPFIPETEYYRSLQFTNGILTNSTPNYSSILSSNNGQSNYNSNDSLTFANSRGSRIRSAITPGTMTQSSLRTSDTISITPFRAASSTYSANAATPSTRTILRSSTVAFQSAQPSVPPATTTTPINIINNSPTTPATTATNIINATNSTTNTIKPPTAQPRFASSAAAAAAAHSRFMLPPSRAFPSSTLASSAIKYSFGHSTIDPTTTNPIASQTAASKTAPNVYPRSRSANVLSMRRTVASPVVMLDGQSHGRNTTTSTDPNTNLYATRRSPNVRQTYGAYYMHHVLLPTTTN
ncbi:unnamed protein product [Adineta steineri]|uniref:Uncharacterized protein n=1 Tax=Adineta steineri TaxID=433720 RepID=A0A813SLC3_9BILA|nr:unnamed protein product [Adineta steineri]CAF3594237.1 unnamed protein product [Adineta steineri]